MVPGGTTGPNADVVPPGAAAGSQRGIGQGISSGTEVRN